MAAENENGLDGITDDDLEAALESFASQASNEDVSDLLEAMNRHSIITWNEAERVMAGGGKREVVKSGLPEQQRPSEPENATNIDDCIHRLEQNDPNLKEININNMKVFYWRWEGRGGEGRGGVGRGGKKRDEVNLDKKDANF